MPSPWSARRALVLALPASLEALFLEAARLAEEARFAALPGLALALPGRGLTLAAAELDLESAAPEDRLASALAL